MSAKKSAAGGGLITTIVMLLVLGSVSSNAGALSQIKDLRDKMTGAGSSAESIALPKITLPTALPKVGLPPTPKAPAAVPSTVPAAQVAAAKKDLASLPVASRSRLAGYSRAQFGQAWTDNNTARLGRNGCDTRNDVLKDQMKGVTFKPGTRNCVVMTGTLNDPYTAKTITFAKAQASKVQIDHVHSLSSAWDLGAASWPMDKRVKFANDVDLNLMAVDGPTNSGKGDDGPGSWMPPNKAYHCGYAAKYIAVVKTYGLKLDRADKPALSAALATCR